MKKFSFAAIVVSIVFATAVSPAGASSRPTGHWASPHGVKTLYVGSQTCQYAVHGHVEYAGSCTWSPRSGGGTLTIAYPVPTRLAIVHYKIVRVNSTTITVSGETFHLT